MKILICNVGSTSLKYQLFDLDCGENILASGGVERVVSLLADVVGIDLYHSALLHGLGGGVSGSGYGYLGVEQQLGLIVKDVIQCAHAVTLIGRHATLMKDDKRQVVGMQSVYQLVHHRAVSFLL